MFESNGAVERTMDTKACKPDYEGQAKVLKEKFDSTGELKEALLNFIEKNDIHRFNKISSIAELLGGLTIIYKEQAARYTNILDRIEENK